MGSGYRTFTAGEVLTASNVQNYLQNQSVMVFADSTARATNIGTANFEEGMVSYLEDSDTVEVYDGSAWASIAPASTQGLTLLQSVTFSAVSSQSINDVFSATYQNYKVVLTLSNSSTTTNVFMRFRISGSDNSTSNYFYMGTGATSAGGTKPLTAASATQLNLMQRAAITGSIADLTIGYPFSSLHTIIAGTTAAYDGSAYYSNAWGGAFNSATSFTGFTIIGESATLTGQVSVYGVNE